MITSTKYAQTYDKYCEVLRASAERISRSQKTRIWLNKNLGEASTAECLARAVECIADLTGDVTLLSKIGKDKK